MSDTAFTDWVDAVPSSENALFNRSNDDDIQELYHQDISPTEQGTYAIDGGDIIWGYWKSGTHFSSDSNTENSLDESLVFIMVSDELSDSLTESLSQSALDALRDQLETGVTFNWINGTGLIPNDGGEIIPLLPESSITLSNSEGVQVEILLEDFGKLIGSNSSDTFSLDGINLIHEACNSNRCFESGEFNGRYIGEEAAAIMSLIEAQGALTGDYSGTGIFVRMTP
ncbi:MULTISPECIES: hypothetical protein [unclassified Halomonas]|uniref:hypothetical protein n=1 Tax=unclassified Halomonas TaxID=2609666 RepID=UPI002076A7FC|nr:MULTISPECIES: hypothetical protein [unclassified Halomonas]